MDDDGFSAATCPCCSVVLRDHAGGLRCPECGATIPAPDVRVPPEFDGPDLDDRR